MNITVLNPFIMPPKNPCDTDSLTLKVKLDIINWKNQGEGMSEIGMNMGLAAHINV